MNTKFFRHYKNKPYRFVGVAKHSESLEDLVIYETLYDNPTAKLWARPKEMFFESVKINERSMPRFAEVPVEIQTTTEMTPSVIQEIEPVLKAGLGEWHPEQFETKFREAKRMCLTTAYVDQQLVGCKLGYEQNSNTFYSWLGAVRPEFRRLGIAHALMKTQHDWCRSNGYDRVITKTQNKYKAMIHLNIDCGFEITGTEIAENGALKIILEKRL